MQFSRLGFSLMGPPGQLWVQHDLMKPDLRRSYRGIHDRRKAKPQRAVDRVILAHEIVRRPHERLMLLARDAPVRPATIYHSALLLWLAGPTPSG